MCIEYNECHYGGMYNVYVKRIFVITEIVRMNEKTGTGVSSEKEKVKESQSRSVTPSLDTHFGCRVRGVIVVFLEVVINDKIVKFSKNCGTFAIKEMGESIINGSLNSKIIIINCQNSSGKSQKF